MPAFHPGATQGLFNNLMNKVQGARGLLGLVVPMTPGDLKTEGIMMAAGAVAGGPVGAGAGKVAASAARLTKMLNKFVDAGAISRTARETFMSLRPKAFGDVPEEIAEKMLRGSADELNNIQRFKRLAEEGLANSKDVKGTIRAVENLEARVASATDVPGDLLQIGKIKGLTPELQKELAEGIAKKRAARLQNLNAADRFNVDKIDEAGNLLERIPAGKRSPKPRLKPTSKDFFGGK